MRKFNQEFKRILQESTQKYLCNVPDKDAIEQAKIIIEVIKRDTHCVPIFPPFQTLLS